MRTQFERLEQSRDLGFTRGADDISNTHEAILGRTAFGHRQGVYRSGMAVDDCVHAKAHPGVSPNHDFERVVTGEAHAFRGFGAHKSDKSIMTFSHRCSSLPTDPQLEIQAFVLHSSPIVDRPCFVCRGAEPPAIMVTGSTL